MSLSDLSIKRPVFAWMLMIGVIVFGLMSFFRLGISQMPDVDFPVATISTSWVGASPETIESAVTDVIEDSVMSIEGIRNITSTCQEGQTSTSIEFDLSRNIDVALQEIQSKLAQAQRNLPSNIDPPIVTKSNPEDQPILWVALTGGKDLREKILFVRNHLKDDLATASGVGDIRLGGYVDPNMRVWISSNKMKNHQITVDDIISALNAGNTLTPSGYIDSGSKETNLKVQSEANTPEAFESLLVPSRGGSPIWKTIRIKDLAHVEEGLADVRRISRLNSVSAIGLGIIKQRGSNAVAVGEAVKERVKSLANLLPKGMSLKQVVDSTKFIKESTHELVFTLTMSVLLASIVCWLFLGSWSSAMNVVLAIPFSLIGTFIILSLLKFTLNTFTLLALSLSVGIVVDDAIMVLENIVRYHEQGKSRVQAALLGAREITGAALAASVAILAIFLPVIFMKGVIGKYFYQFGITMSVAVMLSLLEALTLAPMRCSQFLQTGHHTGLAKAMDRFMNGLVKRYERLLKYCLNHRAKIFIGSILVFCLSLFLVTTLQKEFVPPQDQGRFLMTLQTPMGSSLAFTNETFQNAEEFLKGRNEVDAVFAVVGGFQGGLVNQGNMFVTLKDRSDRRLQEPFKKVPSQQEFMRFARTEISKMKGFKKVTALDLSTAGFTSQRGFPIQFSLQGPDWKKLIELNEKFTQEMSRSGIMTDVDTNFNPDMPEIEVVPNRMAAGDRGVTITNIANSISALLGSLRVGKYTDSSGHRNDVRIKLQEKDSDQPADIQRIWVRNNRGEMIQLSDVVSLEDRKSLLTINRYNRERAISIFANVAPGHAQAEAMDYIEKLSKSILPEGYHTEFSGSSQAFQESFSSLMLALVLGIFVAYMVLGAQFNSFIHPLTVLLALPFSVTGAFIALKITGISLNIYSMIGILLLMGIVKKNSILLVDFTNIKRASGLTPQNALLEACPLRLRPILMTSVATIVAAIPAALAIGPGAETTRPMAVVVIGGVLLSTLLTLFVVPCAYSLFSRFEGAPVKLHD